MTDGGKETNMEIQKLEYLKNEKSFLDEVKNIFHSFLKGYHLVRNEDWIKIVDTSFNNGMVLRRSRWGGGLKFFKKQQ